MQCLLVTDWMFGIHTSNLAYPISPKDHLLSRDMEERTCCLKSLLLLELSAILSHSLSCSARFAADPPIRNAGLARCQYAASAL